jgi:ABC-2 type transport system ATP-binding protein
MLLSKNKVSYIPDEPFYYGRLTGNEFIKFACACKEIEYTQISNKIKKLWESFRFSDKDRNKFIEEYSRGMKKKLNIIIAIINTPDFLIMDEPTESLDPNATKVLKNYITNLKKNDCTIFLSTHLLDTAEYFCDFIGIIKEGNLIFNGSIETLKKNLKRPNSTLEEMFLQITGEENLMM